MRSPRALRSAGVPGAPIFCSRAAKSSHIAFNFATYRAFGDIEPQPTRVTESTTAAALVRMLHRPPHGPKL